MSTIRLFEPGDSRPSATDTLGWYVARYREHLTLRAAGDDYSPRRLKITLSYLDRFVAHVHNEDGTAPVRLGELRLAEAKQLHLTSWLLANYDHWKKGSTRQDAIGAVLTAFTWLEDEGLIASAPFHRPRKLRFPRTHHRAMRREHYRAIQRVARKHSGSRAFRLIHFAAWHTGVRLIEFRRLEPHEIDFQQSVIRLPASKHKSGRRTAKIRPIGVGPRLLSVLQALVAGMKAGQKYVFVTPKGRPWSKDNLGRHYARYRKLAGVPLDVHMCATRHGYSVRLANDGVSTKDIADQLGHSNTRMVESIYAAETRYDADHVREVAERGEKTKRRSKPTPKQPKAKPQQGPSLFDRLE